MTQKIFRLGFLVAALMMANFSFGEVHRAGNYNRVTDSLLTQYFSDTLHAGIKIKALDIRAKELASNPHNKNEAIRAFQIALMLTPYAKDSFETLTRLYADFASVLNEAGASTLSVLYLKNALTCYKTLHPECTSTSYNLCGKLGSFYLGNRQFDSAFYYYNRALVEAKNTGIPIWIAAAQNNMGILLFRQSKNDDAFRHFKNADSVLGVKCREDSVLKSSIADNMAEVLVLQGKFGEAAQLYKANLLCYSAMGIYQDIVKSQLGLGRVYLAQKNMNGLWEQLNAVSKVMSGKSYVDGKYMMPYYDLWRQYYLGTGNLKAALNIQVRLAGYKDSVANTNNQTLSNLTEAIISSDMYKFGSEIELYQTRMLMHERELKDAQLQAKKNRAFFITAGILGFALMVLLFTFYRNRSRIQRDQISIQQNALKIQRDQIELEKMARQLSEAQVNIHELERQKLARELEFKKKDISELGFYLSGLKSMNLSMLNKLGDLKNKMPGEQKESINSMVTELGVITNSQEKATLVQENIEKVNREFTQKLTVMFPELTKSEIELCGLFKMNLTNKEISSLKNISPPSVKMARYRLRKKLGLAPDGDIYQFLSNL